MAISISYEISHLVLTSLLANETLILNGFVFITYSTIYKSTGCKLPFIFIRKEFKYQSCMVDILSKGNPELHNFEKNKPFKITILRYGDPLFYI